MNLLISFSYFDLSIKYWAVVTVSFRECTKIRTYLEC